MYSPSAEVHLADRTARQSPDLSSGDRFPIKDIVFLVKVIICDLSVYCMLFLLSYVKVLMIQSTTSVKRKIDRRHP